jgi:glutaredoxin-like protein NrdH
MGSVTVYSTGPTCIRCTMTCRCLQSAGIPFRVVDVTAEPIALQFVTEELGYTEAPVVIVDEEPQHHWSGFRPDLIDRLADRLIASRSPQIAPHSGLGLG